MYLLAALIFNDKVLGSILAPMIICYEEIVSFSESIRVKSGWQ